eukprot:5717631-Pyramimonas_sp.AAC.2
MGGFFNAAWYRYELLETTSKASGAAPKGKTAEYYNIEEKKGQDFDISTRQGLLRRLGSAGQPAQSSAGQPVLAWEMPVGFRKYGGSLRTATRMRINPADHPKFDDGSDRYIVVQWIMQGAAVLADGDAHARQFIRILSRKRLAHVRFGEGRLAWSP